MYWSNRIRDGWTPWHELRRLQSGLLEMPGRRQRPGSPPVNVWIGEEGALVRAEIPGLDPEGIELSVQGDTLRLRGERPAEELSEGEVRQRSERDLRTFARRIQLPFEVSSEGVEASYRRGVLEVRLPRSPRDQPRKIAVSVS